MEVGLGNEEEDKKDGSDHHGYLKSTEDFMGSEAVRPGMKRTPEIFPQGSQDTVDEPVPSAFVGEPCSWSGSRLRCFATKSLSKMSCAKRWKIACGKSS